MEVRAGLLPLKISKHLFDLTTYLATYFIHTDHDMFARKSHDSLFKVDFASYHRHVILDVSSPMNFGPIIFRFNLVWSIKTTLRTSSPPLGNPL
jgi:hypothetical protein